MAVFRAEKSKGYTVMSNHHLLTLKAKGLLSQMLSLPPRRKPNGITKSDDILKRDLTAESPCEKCVTDNGNHRE